MSEVKNTKGLTRPRAPFAFASGVLHRSNSRECLPWDVAVEHQGLSELHEAMAAECGEQDGSHLNPKKLKNGLLRLRTSAKPRRRARRNCDLSLAKIKSEFRINDIRRGCVTCYMDDIKTSRRFGEGHPKPGRLLAARSFAGSRSDKSTKQKPRPCRIYRQQFI